jgi:DNA-directed RNA polymerase specialized sigma24 family protein
LNAPAASGTTPTIARIVPPVPPIAIPATISAPAASGGWLRSILARTVIGAYRRRADLRTADPAELDILISDVADAETVAAAAEDELALRAALRSLAPADRIALVLHDAERWPASEVAELLDVGTEAAHKRIQLARTRLISALSDPASPVVTPRPRSLPRRPRACA